MRAYGEILGLVPYDLRASGLEDAQKSLWSERDGRFPVPLAFGLGSTLGVALERRVKGIDLAL